MCNELKDKVVYKKKSVWEDIDNEKKGIIFEFAEDYKKYLDNSKTERESIDATIKILEENGFSDMKKDEKNGKFYSIYKSTALVAASINDPENLKNGVLIVGSHVDAPRLDLKSRTIIEDYNLSLMKTRYYGGIKKYQWVGRSLALHGVIALENGEILEINIGEDPEDPIFTITDLLPHLAQKQIKKDGTSIIEGEQLNILVGSIPYNFKNEKDSIKLNILNLLNEKYGIVEEDLISSNLYLVPAEKAKDVGFDRSLVGAYGQDDKICAYTSLKAITDVETDKNIIALFLDKEEIGSVGNSGANSNIIERVVSDILNRYGYNSYNDLLTCLRNSSGLSADVNTAIDPSWPEVHDKNNGAVLGEGVCVTKYIGGRGKGGSNEPRAEFVAKIRGAFNKDSVVWQAAEFGKVDHGGAGTISSFMAKTGMEVIDCGPAVLSMHAPMEVASKGDLYHTYLCYKSFYKYL